MCCYLSCFITTWSAYHNVGGHRVCRQILTLPLLVGESWANDLILLCLCFLLYKMRDVGTEEPRADRISDISWVLTLKGLGIDLQQRMQTLESLWLLVFHTPWLWPNCFPFWLLSAGCTLAPQLGLRVWNMESGFLLFSVSLNRGYTTPIMVLIIKLKIAIYFI